MRANIGPKFFNNQIARLFFVSFLVAMLLPIGMLSYVYVESTRIVESEIEQYNGNIIDRCKQNAESIFLLADNLMSTMATNADVNAFVAEGSSYHSSDQLGKVTDAFNFLSDSRYIMEHAGMLEFIVHARKSQSIVSYRAGYARAGNYYNNSLVVEGLDAESLANGALGESIMAARDMMLFDKPVNAIILKMPIIMNSLASKDGCILTLLDTAPFVDVMRDLNLSDDGFAYIANPDGSILLQVGGENMERYQSVSNIAVDDSQYLVLRSSTAGSGRSYAAYVPKSIVLSRVFYIKRLIIALSAIGILCSLAFAVVLAQRNAKPILDIFKIVQDKSGDASPKSYDFLKGTISNIISSNEALSRALSEQMPVARANLVRRLINGSIFLPNELSSTARHLGINLEASGYAVLQAYSTTYGDMIDPKVLSEVEKARTLVTEAFERCDAFRTLYYTSNISEIVMLLLFDQVDQPRRAVLEKAVLRISTQLKDEFNVSFHYVCGGFTDRISEVSDLYSNVRSVRANALARGDDLLLFYEDAQFSRSIYYPIYEESRLIKCASLNQREVIADIVRKIIDKNTEADQYSRETMAFLTRCFYLTAVRILENLPWSDNMMKQAGALLEQDSILEPRELERRVMELMGRIMDMQQSRLETEHERELSEIARFIEQNLYDSTFTLYKVAMHFNFAESYLYKLIRDQMGCTFSVLLEKLRMDKAAQLLQNPAMTIDEIAIETGYTSAHTFRRVFKKHYSMLPTDYREIH